MSGPRIPDTEGVSGTWAALERHQPCAGTMSFGFGDHPVRVLMIDGEPWFVLADLCRALQISDISIVRRRLDDALCQIHPIEDSLGRTQNVTIVSEPGMYEVIIRSDKPGAAEFRRWITGRVLPAIRKTGSYSIAPQLEGPELFARAVLEAQAMLAAKDERIAELEPKAEFYDDLMDADGTYSFLAASKILGWGRNVMMRELRRSGVLQGNNLPYQRYEHHFKVTPVTYTNQKTGELVPTATTTVRPSGLEFLRKKLDRSPVVTS